MKFKKGDKKIYDEAFDGLSYYQTTGEVYHTNRSKHKFHKFYLEAIKGRSKPKVLDIGCYVGTELFMLPKSNPNIKYWGVDISQNTVNYARALAKKRGEDNITFETVDGNKSFKYPDNFFDVIYALELVEHLNYPTKFIKEIRRILKKDGVFIISTPNGDTFLNKIQKLLPKIISHKIYLSRERDFTRHGKVANIDSSVWDNDAHVSLWGYNRWKSVFETEGFYVEKVEGSSFYGGSRYISERPFLLGLMILLDSFIDLLPFKPFFQMCMILKLKKYSYNESQ